jgi:hypothetical protein
MFTDDRTLVSSGLVAVCCDFGKGSGHNLGEGRVVLLVHDGTSGFCLVMALSLTIMCSVGLNGLDEELERIWKDAVGY